jgi:hypothetical protein
VEILGKHTGLTSTACERNQQMSGRLYKSVWGGGGDGLYNFYGPYSHAALGNRIPSADTPPEITIYFVVYLKSQ